MSTVRGKKSVPSRTERAATAVANRTVSPMRPSTAPSASCANFPVSNVRVRSVPLMGPDTEMASAMMLLVFGVWGHLLAGSQWSTTSLLEVTGDWQPASRDARMCSLPPNAEAADDGAVALDVVLAAVVEQPTTLADEFHQAASRVVVPFVTLQMLRQMVDPPRQQCDLHLR